jgi:hypothetical protein
VSDQLQRIRDLEEKVRQLEALRNQLVGMSKAAIIGYRALYVLAGYGGIEAMHRIIAWLNAPFKHP